MARALTVQSEHLKPGHNAHVLQSLHAELVDEGVQAPRLAFDLIDRALLSNLSEHVTEPFRYLLGCWRRIQNALRTIRRDDQADRKIATLNEAKRLVISYAGLCITTPDLFK